uniref:Uncharacterized protein n=1 Tax=Arundo donax TaxID=35708 RepID=A0A0A9H6V7_ARUDO
MMAMRAATAASLDGQCTSPPPCMATMAAAVTKEVAVKEAAWMMAMATSVTGAEVAIRLMKIMLMMTPWHPMLQPDQLKCRCHPCQKTAAKKKMKAMERTAMVAAPTRRTKRRKKVMHVPSSRRAPARKPARSTKEKATPQGEAMANEAALHEEASSSGKRLNVLASQY